MARPPCLPRPMRVSLRRPRPRMCNPTRRRCRQRRPPPRWRPVSRRRETGLHRGGGLRCRQRRRVGLHIRGRGRRRETRIGLGRHGGLAIALRRRSGERLRRRRCLGQGGDHGWRGRLVAQQAVLALPQPVVEQRHQQQEEGQAQQGQQHPAMHGRGSKGDAGARRGDGLRHGRLRIDGRDELLGIDSHHPRVIAHETTQEHLAGQMREILGFQRLHLARAHFQLGGDVGRTEFAGLAGGLELRPETGQ